MTDHQAQVRAVMELALSGASKDKIRNAAVAVKQALNEEVAALWRTATLVDSLVAMYVNDPSWPLGFLPAPPAAPVAGPQQLRQPNRTQRILEVARKMAESGDGTVSGKAVAEQLRNEGDQTPIRNLAVSAGNLMARSNEWETVKPGVYRLVQRKDVAI
ncbi:MAG TPA: hypothetical protein VIR57_20965 [Chloroflexota bacterium]|jgi:hypothetical protein